MSCVGLQKLSNSFQAQGTGQTYTGHQAVLVTGPGAKGNQLIAFQFIGILYQLTTTSRIVRLSTLTISSQISTVILIKATCAAWILMMMVVRWDGSMTAVMPAASGSQTSQIRHNKSHGTLQRIFVYQNIQARHWQLLTRQLCQWAGQEPDNVANQENCAVMRMSGQFSDRGCETVANFVCKSQLNNAVPTEDLGCGTWLRADQFCYHINNNGPTLSWTDAQNDCKQQGGNLLTMDSLNTKAWLFEQLRQPANNRPYWTGLNDRQSEGLYIWPDGTHLNKNVIWFNREPRNMRGDENCAVIYNSGHLNDVSCSSHAAAICEMNMDHGACPTNWIASTKSCYLFTQFYNDSVLYTHGEAMNYCEHFSNNVGSQAHLLSISSQDELAFISNQLHSLPENIYGWYTSLRNNGVWQYADGTLDPKLILWGGEPSVNSGDDCAMLNGSGDLHMRMCGLKLHYICQKPVESKDSNSTKPGETNDSNRT